MDVDDEPLLFRDEDDEEEEEAEVVAEEGGVWRMVAWVYTQTWTSVLVLGVSVLLPCGLFAYMLLYCPPLEIDLSYSAFQVHTHFSAERFDALAVAVKTQLSSWDRQRRDVDRIESKDLLRKLDPQPVISRTEPDPQPVVTRTELDPQPVVSRTKPDPQPMVSKTEPDPHTVVNKTEPVVSRTEPDPQTLVSRTKPVVSRTEPDPQPMVSRTEPVVSRIEPDPQTVVSRLEPVVSRTEPDPQTLVSGTEPEERLRRRRRFSPSYQQTQAQWRMELVFVAQGEGDLNIFTPERLRTVHHVERLLMQQPDFHRFCWKPLELLRDLPLGPSYCCPPSSLLTYLYPSERAGKIYYDGMGPDLADIQGSLQLAISHPQFYWFVDEGLSPAHLSSSLLRSEIHFGAPLPSFSSPQDRAHQQRDRFRDFVLGYADVLSKQSTSQVKVLYGGTELFDNEVRNIFHGDMKLAFISGACITLLVYVLTSFSVFLTFFGLLSIGLSCLTALFLYHVVFGVRYLGILNGVAAFVIIGIGVDDVFVFINTFRQAAHLRRPRQRITYTIKTAGRATFLTSFTTAAAYAANAFSQIPAVHDFGLFMALTVSCCWLSVTVAMPAALYLWTQWAEPLENSWRKYFPFLSWSHAPLSDKDHDDDDDVALLSVDPGPGETVLDPGPGETVLMLSVEALPSGAGHREVGVVSTNLRWLLRHLVAEPAVERRKTVLGVFLLTLVLSASCCSLLRSASRAPQLFRSDTNLQTLLALRSNLSAPGISCSMCSGVFMEKPHSQQTSGSTHTLKPRPSSEPTASLLTVHVFRLDLGASATLYRFSLNASAPPPWTRPQDTQEVTSFQAYSAPYSSFTSRVTVCRSHFYHPFSSWMLTRGSCEHGWTSDFSFFVAASPQPHNCRRLYFAQQKLRPHPSRVCVAPPGCGFGSGANRANRANGDDGADGANGADVANGANRADGANGADGRTQGVFYSPVSSAPPLGTKANRSRTLGFNPCSGGTCPRPAVRPLVDTGAMVFVVFGILGVNRSQSRDNHVLGDLGSVVLDPDFDIFQEMGHLCKICKSISANSQLVKEGGAQCMPSGKEVSSLLPLLHPDCGSLPEPRLLPGQLSHAALGVMEGRVRWVSMAFESTTYKGKSSFQTYSDFLRWETFVQDLLSRLPPSSALKRGFQTCEHWKQIFMEIIGVESALWSLFLSLVICVAAVSVFTAHPLLLTPVLLTILGVICLVVALMYLMGWELGAVEALSLSILVGSSVDYCLHLVEGYLITAETLSPSSNQSSLRRQTRTLEAVSQVGVAIVSSAVTTAIAAVPLFFCVIVPFAKFGQIVALNTAVSVLFTLTATVAMLACVAPPDFSRPPGAVLKAGGAAVAGAGVVAALWWAGSQLGVLAWTHIST